MSLSFSSASLCLKTRSLNRLPYFRKNDSPTNPAINMAAIMPIRFRSVITYWYWLFSCSGLVGPNWSLLALTRLNAAELRVLVLPRRDVRPAIFAILSFIILCRRIIDLPTWQQPQSSVYRPNRGNTRLMSRLPHWWSP